MLSVKLAIDGSTQNVSESVTQNMIAWRTNSGGAHSAVKKIRLTLKMHTKLKFFLRYVDDIVRTVRGDTKELLDAVNNLLPNLQLKLETTDDKTV